MECVLGDRPRARRALQAFAGRVAQAKQHAAAASLRAPLENLVKQARGASAQGTGQKTAVVMLSLAAGARAAVHHAPGVAAAPAAFAASTPEATELASSDPPNASGGELSAGLTAAALTPLGTDAPGTDSILTGRPAGATRLLDTSVDAQGSRLRVYSASASQAALEPALARTLAGHGFARMTSVDLQTVSFTRGHDHVVLRFARRDDRTIVSIVELGFRVAGEDR